MRLLLAILLMILVGIWALGAVFDSLAESVDRGGTRTWPISRPR